MNTIVSRVDYACSPAGREVYRIAYDRGGEIAWVTVSVTGDVVDAECEELPADSFHDEFVLETLAEGFVDEHGSGFGEVGSL